MLQFKAFLLLSNVNSRLSYDDNDDDDDGRLIDKKKKK